MPYITHTSTGATNTPRLLKVTGSVIAPPTDSLFCIFDERGITYDPVTLAISQWDNQVPDSRPYSLFPPIADIWRQAPLYDGEELGGSPSIKFNPSGNYGGVYGQSGYKSCYLGIGAGGISPHYEHSGNVTLAWLANVKPDYQASINGSLKYGGGRHTLGEWTFIFSPGSPGHGCGLLVKGRSDCGTINTRYWSRKTWNRNVEEHANQDAIPIYDAWVLYIITGEIQIDGKFRETMYQWETLQNQEFTIVNNNTYSVSFFCVGDSGNYSTSLFGDIRCCYGWDKCLTQIEIEQLCKYLRSKYGLL